MPAQINPGDLVTYEGVMQPRAMQRCQVLLTYRCGDLALRFPDGATVRTTRAGITKIIAPQYKPDF